MGRTLAPGASLTGHLAATIRRHGLLRPGERVLVALSGGADSVALLAGLRTLGYTVEAAHCNFHLRGAESERDETFCRTLCRNLGGIPLHIAQFDTRAEAERSGESLEMAARRLRYTWFETLRHERGIRRVAVAHHRDDNVETMLLNLIRGTGLRGLTGMKYRNGAIVRPLLDLSRDDLLQYVNGEGLGYVTDSSNADTAFKRNKVRHVVLPLLRELNPAADATLAATAQRLADAEELYALGLAQAGQSLRHEGGGMDIPLGTGRPPRAALFEWLAAAGFPKVMVRELTEGPAPRDGALFEGRDAVAVVHRGMLEIRPRPIRFGAVRLPAGTTVLPNGWRIEAEDLPHGLTEGLPRERTTVCLDADALRGQLCCRSVVEGDRFAPYGLKGTKLVSDFLTDRHYSRLDRQAAMAVTDDAGIVWLAGERPDRRACITAETRRAIRLRLIPPPPGTLETSR